MVKDLYSIITRQDFESEEDTRSLVFICANHPEYSLPFAALTRYPVLETYAEYWEKGNAVQQENARILEVLFPKDKPEEHQEKVILNGRLALQKKFIKKYLKNHPVSEKI